MIDLETIVDKCLALILGADREGTNQLIDQWIKDNDSSNIMSQILEPVMLRLGELWRNQEDITFAQVYVSARIAEDIIMKTLDSEHHSGHYKGKIIIGNIEDDFHSLGRRLVATFLIAAGWEVLDLGNDVVAEEFVDTAQREGAKVIMVSAMMYTTAVNIKKVRDVINNRGLQNQIYLFAGGAIFNLRKELWREVGADGSASNASEVNDVLNEFLDQRP